MVLLLLAATALARAASARLGAGEEAVARLDGKPITRTDLYNEMLLEHGRQTFRRMLGRRLVEAELVRQGIVIADAEIDAVYAEKAREFREANGPDADLAAALQAQFGATPAEYKARIIRYDLALKALLKQEMSPDARDLFNYFFAHRSRYREAARAKIRHILIDPLRLLDRSAGAGRRRVTEKEWRRALKEAEGVRARLLKGEDFEKVAAAVSHEETATPGAAGWIERGAGIHKGLEAAIFALAPGEVTEPIKSVVGYHLVRLEAKEEAKELRYGDVKDRVREDYEQHLVTVNTTRYLDTLRRRAEAEGRLEVYIQGF